MNEQSTLISEQPVDMQGLDATAFHATALEAMRALRWQPLYTTSSYIAARVLNVAGWGDVAELQIREHSAHLTIRPGGDYYHTPEETQANATMFQNAMIALVAAQRKADHHKLKAKDKEKWGALVPSATYQVTPWLVYLNALVFIAVIFFGVTPITPTAKSLFTVGGNFGPAVVHGQWWRLITYMFLHGGILHLVMNTWALLYVGMYLEPLLGKLRFAAVYLFTGVCAGLLSIVMHPASVGVGASGAIFGLYGVFAALLTTNYVEKTVRKTMLRSILFFVLYNLLNGLQGNVDNAAHIGGLLSGLLAGFAFYPGIRSNAGTKNQLAVSSVMGVVVAGLAAATIYVLGR